MDGMMGGSSMSGFLGRAAAAAALAALVAGCGVIGGKHRPVTPTFGNRTPILSHVGNDVSPDPTLAQVAVVLPPDCCCRSCCTALTIPDVPCWGQRGPGQKAKHSFETPITTSRSSCRPSASIGCRSA